MKWRETHALLFGYSRGLAGGELDGRYEHDAALQAAAERGHALGRRK